MPTPKLTLDTNLLQELWKDRAKADSVLELISLAEQGKVDLAVTARIREDIPNEPLKSKLDELTLLNISETGSVTRLGYWVLGRDMLGEKGFERRLLEAQELARKRIGRRSRSKPPEWKDWDHLHAHMLEGRDYFVTLDKGILSVTRELQDWFGVTVLTLEDVLVLLHSKLT